MPTFPDWERIVLERTYEHVEYVSLHNYFDSHRYSGKGAGTVLAQSLDMDAFIREVIATCDHVGAKKRSKKRVNLAFDEWNVWSSSRYLSLRELRWWTWPDRASLEATRAEGGQDLGLGYPEEAGEWPTGAALAEDTYTLVDALVVGCLLITLMRHAERVKIACLAQLVNVLAPIMTRTSGNAWRQTIFWPFLHASRYGRGTALHVPVDAPTYEDDQFGPVPLLETIAVLDGERGEASIFVVNRSQEGPLPLEAVVRGLDGYRVAEHLVLEHDDPGATNTAEHPDVVVPHGRGDAAMDGGRLTALLPKLSWSVIRLAAPGRTPNGSGG
jgi:alpha-N-arabinofuranosidase